MKLTSPVLYRTPAPRRWLIVKVRDVFGAARLAVLLFTEACGEVHLWHFRHSGMRGQRFDKRAAACNYPVFVPSPRLSIVPAL